MQNQFNQFNIDVKINDPFIEIGPSEVKFKIQNGPIKECGVNGTQIDSLLKVYVEILKIFNCDFPSKFNIKTIEFVELALKEQENRKKDREKRGVEGKSIK